MELDPRLASGSDTPASQEKSPRLHRNDDQRQDTEDDDVEVDDQLAEQQLHHSQPGDQAHDGSDAKRSRACEACRGLKVRCEPDPDEGPCKRCKKAGRQCVVTAPSRKRQRKTDSRVSELERKIDALTHSLQARSAAAAAAAAAASTEPQAQSSTMHLHQHQNAPPRGSPGYDYRTDRGSPLMHRNQSADASSGNARSWANETSRHGSVDRLSANSATAPPPPPTRMSQPSSTPSDHASTFQPPLVMAGQKRKASDRGGHDDDVHRAPSRQPAAPSPWARSSQEGDVVERGVITMELAADIFARFLDHMLPHLPVLAFSSGSTVAELRRTRPILFLAIMTAAASHMGSLQKTLQKDLMQALAEKVFLTGDKSMELVQAILVAVVWYSPPDNFEELKFYQLVHTAAVMAIDIGLGRKQPPGAKASISPYSWQNHPFRRNPLPDPASIEARRTWLACFFMTSNTSIALRRPNLVRWTTFMAESVEILESSPEAAPSDKYFCHLVWTHRLSEDIAAQFSLDDPSVLVDVKSHRSQHVLKALERDLESYRTSVSEDLMLPTLKMGFNMLNLWMHEAVLHSNTAVDQLRPPFNTDNFKDSVIGSEPLSAALISAVSACIVAADGIFETFLSLDVTTLRCLPSYNFVRVAYSLVIMLKMYFSASSPGSELGKVIDKDSLKVEFYLNALLDKFRLVATDDRSRVASKFLVVLAMLRGWFAKQGKLDGRSDGGNPSPRGYGPSSNKQNQDQNQNQNQQQQQQYHHHHHNANTPLQLLSEVATGSESSHPRGSTSSHSVVSNMRQVPQTFFYDTPPSSSTTTATPDMNRGASSADPQQCQPPPPPPPPPTSSDSTFTPIPPPHHHHQQSETQWMSQPFPSDGGPTVGEAFDFALSIAPDPVMGYENGEMTTLNNAWFNDVFLGLQEPSNLFPF